MNLEEKENTAEVAPEAAAQATNQAVQENNAQDAGVQETAGAAAPQEQPVKKSQATVGIYAKQAGHTTATGTEHIKELDKLVD